MVHKDGVSGGDNDVDGGERLLALVADDDADVRELVAFRLEREGYEVLTAADGAQALELTSAHVPAVAILDVMMPGLDGYEVTRRMRADPRLSEVPVVLLTASVQEAAVTRGFEAGADDYVKKPFSPAEFIDRLRQVVRRD
ncbi:response regulator [Thermoleophilia bacterium SCSIO 60948]|nr:response regulator [Thermoleophilia bacterium SCSIO 60948]